MTDRERALRGRVMALIERGFRGVVADEEFEALALEVFRFQVDAVGPYGAWVRSTGRSEPRRWSEIPPVPARAFRDFPIVAGPPEGAEATFRTSGTTGGGSRRGVHHVRDLSLYRASLLASGSANLNPGAERLRVLALLPAPAARPDSSLVHMAGAFLEAWDDGGGRFLADADWALDAETVRRAFAEAAGDRVPVALLGTSFAFLHLLEGAAADLPALPGGSRVMDTGGFKGRTRSVPRDELHRRISEGFGVPRPRIVNEYGMTELLSQFWETTLAEEAAGAQDDAGGRTGGRAEGTAKNRAERRASRRSLASPPWLRTRVLHPETLAPLPMGEPGLLCHVDLANLFSVSAILTEDVGEAVPGGRIRVHGRSPGSEPRGCSLTMEEMIAARAEGEV